jgi:hypothetical protein
MFSSQSVWPFEVLQSSSALLFSDDLPVNSERHGLMEHVLTYMSSASRIQRVPHARVKIRRCGRALLFHL